MEERERLRAPEIKLAGLEIWVHGRQFPDDNDFWDGNWVRATVYCHAPGSEVLVSGPIIRLPEIEQWCKETAHMRDTLSGKATLACMEPNLFVEMTAGSLGHIDMEARITPDHLTQQHTFKFEIDQSYLDPLLAQCRAVLAEYPVRGG